MRTIALLTFAVACSRATAPGPASSPAVATAPAARMTADAAGSQLLARAKARAAGEPVAGDALCEQCHGR